MSFDHHDASRGGAGPVFRFSVSGSGAEEAQTPSGAGGVSPRATGEDRGDASDADPGGCPSTAFGGPPPPQGEEAVVCRSKRPGKRTSAAAFAGPEPAPDDPLLGFAPYEHVAPRRNSITPARQRAFIAALAASGIVTQAARTVGVSLEALYKLRHRPGAEAFAKAWDEAIDRGMMRLEDCALERALMGEVRPVVSQGKLVTTWVRHDTQLLLFLLRQRRADRYGGPEEIRREAARHARDYNSAAILDSINAKIEKMRTRRLAAEAWKGDCDGGGDGDGEE